MGWNTYFYIKNPVFTLSVFDNISQYQLKIIMEVTCSEKLISHRMEIVILKRLNQKFGSYTGRSSRRNELYNYLRCGADCIRTHSFSGFGLGTLLLPAFALFWKTVLWSQIHSDRRWLIRVFRWLVRPSGSLAYRFSDTRRTAKRDLYQIHGSICCYGGYISAPCLRQHILCQGFWDLAARTGRRILRWPVHIISISLSPCSPLDFQQGLNKMTQK